MFQPQLEQIEARGRAVEGEEFCSFPSQIADFLGLQIERVSYRGEIDRFTPVANQNFSGQLKLQP